MLGVGLWGCRRCGGTYGVFEGWNMSGVTRRRYAVRVGEGGQKGCPLTVGDNAIQSEYQQDGELLAMNKASPLDTASSL